MELEVLEGEGLTGTAAMTQEDDDGGFVGGKFEAGMHGRLFAGLGDGRQLLGGRCLEGFPLL